MGSCSHPYAMLRTSDQSSGHMWISLKSMSGGEKLLLKSWPVCWGHVAPSSDCAGDSHAAMTTDWQASMPPISVPTDRGRAATCNVSRTHGSVSIVLPCDDAARWAACSC